MENRMTKMYGSQFLWHRNLGNKHGVETFCLLLSLHSFLGYKIMDTHTPNFLYNNKDACVQWCHNMTTKWNHHIKNQENLVREWVKDRTLTTTHVNANETLPTFSLRKCMAVPVSAAKVIHVYPEAPIFLNEGSTTFIHPQNHGYIYPRSYPCCPDCKLHPTHCPRILPWPNISCIFSFSYFHTLSCYIICIMQVTMSDPMGGVTVGYSLPIIAFLSKLAKIRAHLPVTCKSTLVTQKHPQLHPIMF
jgi:hypothetical protein